MDFLEFGWNSLLVMRCSQLSRLPVTFYGQL